ncbi:hypothetical protein Tco_0944549 [Tanacetum coccineum]
MLLQRKHFEEDALESNDGLQQANDKQTNFENQKINDEDEESEDAFIYIPKDYVPTDDETNDETNDVDEEEYERVNVEMYSDVNISLTDAEHNDEEKGDAEMTNVAHVQVKQTQEQTTGVQEESGPEMASTQVPPLSSSHSVSSTYTNAFLNLENLHYAKMEVVSKMDINVQHEVLRTSLLLTIPVSVVPEHTVFNPSETSTLDLGSSLDDTLYKVIQRHFANIIKEYSVAVEIVERLKQQYAP